MTPPDIVSIIKNRGSTIATVNRPTGGGSGGGNQSPDETYIKKIDFRRYEFSNPVMQFHVQHNMATTQYLETVRDSNGNKIFCNIQPVDENSFLVNLTEAMTGYVDVLFGIEYTP